VPRVIYLEIIINNVDRCAIPDVCRLPTCIAAVCLGDHLCKTIQWSRSNGRWAHNEFYNIKLWMPFDDVIFAYSLPRTVRSSVLYCSGLATKHYSRQANESTWVESIVVAYLFSIIVSVVIISIFALLFVEFADLCQPRNREVVSHAGRKMAPVSL